MDNQAIRAMIAANPAATDAEIVALFGAERDEWVNVAVADLEGVCRRSGLLSRLEDAVVANPTPSFPRTAAKELLGMIQGKLATIEMRDASGRAGLLAMLGALVAVGWVLEDERAAILALAQRRRTVAESEGCEGIQIEHVALARVGG